MKKYLLLAVMLSTFTFATAQSSFFELSDTFFQKYVNENGQVDYVSIKKNQQILKDLYTQIEQFDLTAKSDSFKKAFYINAYNVLVIKQVIDLLPLGSPLDDEGFFKKTQHFVAGKKMTLDQLEKGTIFKSYPDPRLHFVLVCAAKSCPPLAMKAFVPRDLDRQLEDRTRYILNLPWFILVTDMEVQLSQIFKWYQADFGGSEKNLLKYVNKYRSQEIKSDKVGYYEYNWTLNGQDK